MDEKRLRELAGLDENKEVLKEAIVTTRSKEGPFFDSSIQKKLFGAPKKEFVTTLNFSSFKVSQDFIAKDAPDDVDERHIWEEKKSKELAKKANSLVKRFISDLKKTLKTVK